MGVSSQGDDVRTTGKKAGIDSSNESNVTLTP